MWKLIIIIGHKINGTSSRVLWRELGREEERGRERSCVLLGFIYVYKEGHPTLRHTYSMELMSFMKDVAIVSLGGYEFERTKLKGTYVF